MVAPPAEELVGRTAELAAVDEALAALERGRALALAVIGEPGIGKTSLLAALDARAEERGLLVLSGSASELESDLPFAVFADALDDYVQALEPRRLEQLPPDVRAELGQVLPSLAGGPASAGPQDHRFRTHRAVRRLLEVLAEPKPLVLVLDDLHWADSGSIELLGAVLRRPPAAPVLIAVAARPRQASPRLWSALERAGGAGILTRIEPGTLSAGDARLMLAGDLHTAAADAVYAAAGGNPFYLRQLARTGGALTADGAEPAALGEAAVPRSVVAALTGELAGLDGDVRRVLEGAAVAGDPFEPELAARAAGADVAAATDALDALLERDLVRHTDVPRRFRFRHPLVRRAVYDAAPGGWRLLAHERCAAALAERGAPAQARAHHVEHAARHGDAEAIAVLREAADAIAQRTPAGAAGWYGAALRLLPAAAPAAERVGLRAARASALASAGEFEAAHAELEEAIADGPPAGALRTQLIAGCASVDQLLSRHEVARRRLEDALAELPDADSAQGVALIVALANNRAYLQDYAGARAWAARAHEYAQRLGEPGPLAEAAATLGLTSAFVDDVEAARRHHAEACELVDGLPDEVLAPHLTALVNLFSSELYLDRYAAGAAHATRCVKIALATSQRSLYPSLLPMLGTLLLLSGRMEEAAEQEDGAIEAARLAGHEQALAWALFHRAFAALRAGDLDLAFEAGTEAVALTREGDESVVGSFCRTVLAMAITERGDPQDGAALLLAGGGGALMPRIPGAWRAYYLDCLAEALLGAGRREEAAAAAAEAGRLAGATGLGLATFAARRAAARVALADDPRAAAAAAGEAVATAESVGAPIEAGLCRVLEGTALAAAGERDAAIAVLEQAARELDALGALRARDAAERELRRLGRRDLHRRTRAGRADGTGLETLTERELQIARLIVDRKTNPQIAAELFLSTKTIETHIRHVFQKLGVSSRVEVARAVERADRAG
ncbi:MAG: BREX system ATP-binding domain-containing protein [Solirubrobacteraceae bacterium]